MPIASDFDDTVEKPAIRNLDKNKGDFGKSRIDFGRY